MPSLYSLPIITEPIHDHIYPTTSMPSTFQLSSNHKHYILFSQALTTAIHSTINSKEMIDHRIQPLIHAPTNTIDLDEYEDTSKTQDRSNHSNHHQNTRCITSANCD
eukprot:27560_1